MQGSSGGRCADKASTAPLRRVAAIPISYFIPWPMTCLFVPPAHTAVGVAGARGPGSEQYSSGGACDSI